MSFLEPLLLLAMPLIGLPIVIHMLNQRRHKTAPWAARQFVLQASNMGRGMAAMRHWIVLALRTLAIAALIFAISRPLASRVPGLGFLGSQRAQVIVVDRSPSMAIRDSATGLTWREAGLSQLQDHLRTVGGRQFLCQSLASQPISVNGAELTGMLETTVTGTQSNIPELVEQSLEYIDSQAIGPSDIWVCTDRQSSDWRLDSGRWNRIREQLESMPEVKLHFITPDPSTEFNLAVSTDNVKLIREEDKQFVYLDFSVQQTSGQIQQRSIPVHVQVAGIERNVDIQMVAGDYKYQQLKIEVPTELAQGSGVVRLPLDSNEVDNQFYFSFSQQPAHNSVVVSDNRDIANLLELVCATPFEPNTVAQCNVLPVSGQAEIDWQNTALVVWHAALPTGPVAEQMTNFIADGGRVVFLPVDSIGGQAELFGVRWGAWEGQELDFTRSAVVGSTESQVLYSSSANGSAQPSKFQVAQWRTQDDLLATDDSGRQLPLESIVCSRRCGIESSTASMLASFEDGQPMLVRAATDSGGVYFLCTTPDEANSSFTDDGIALYVMFQRALEKGASAMGKSKQLVTGSTTIKDSHLWVPLELNQSVVAEDQRAYFAGVYEKDGEVIAINRPVSEDSAGTIDPAAITKVLGEDSFDLVTTSASSLAGLTNEIWKLFVIVMVIALIAEGWFSLPTKRSKVATEASA